MEAWIRSKVIVLELTTYVAVVQKAMISESVSELSQRKRTRRKGRKMEMQAESPYQGISHNYFSKEPGFHPRKNVSFKRPEVGSEG